MQKPSTHKVTMSKNDCHHLPLKSFWYDLMTFQIDFYDFSNVEKDTVDVSLKMSLDVSGVNATIMRFSTQGDYLVAAGEGLLQVRYHNILLINLPYS